MGADTGSVKTLFRNDMVDIVAKSQILQEARIVHSTIAIAVCRKENKNANVIMAQVADELLGVNDVKASFVLGINESGQVNISARSLGEINVQFYMEKIGGGGHLTMAGAQLEMTLDEAEARLLEIIGEIIKEGDDK